MGLLRICAIGSLRLPIPQRKRDKGIQSAKSRKVVKPGWPDVRSALALAQDRRLSCWSPDPRWRMNGPVATTIGGGLNSKPTYTQPAPSRLATPVVLLDRPNHDGPGTLAEAEESTEELQVG